MGRTSLRGTGRTETTWETMTSRTSFLTGLKTMAEKVTVKRTMPVSGSMRPSEMFSFAISRIMIT